MDFESAVELASSVLALEDLYDEVGRLAAIVLHHLEREDDAQLAQHISVATTQSLSYDALWRAAAIRLSRCETLPFLLSRWVGQEVLNSGPKGKRPATPRKHRKGINGVDIVSGAFGDRNVRIYEAVCALAEHGVSPHRNEATAGGSSGFDIVAEALKRGGEDVTSYVGVNKIYHAVKGRIEAGRDPRPAINYFYTHLPPSRYGRV